MSLAPKLSPEENMAMETLRDKGFAVVIFNPFELEGSDPDLIQDILIERGWNAIETLKVENGL